jgi:hypothetical protein
MAQDFNYQGNAMAEQRGEMAHDGGNGMAAPLAPHSAAHAGLPVHSELKRFRLSKRESQEKFWGRFGVTQSSGSRFETGLGIPAPVAILVKLYVRGKLNDGDLPG